MEDNIAPDDPLKGKFLLDENGRPVCTADGGKVPLAWFDNDPTDLPEPTEEQVDADIEMLGLSEFLPDEEDKTKK
jgi:hypothetical protein